jgi:AcrR family transcriptional regulator
MVRGTRQRMIEGAARLLAKHGLAATSFSTVLAESGAPRGSIYFHFPGGKDELVMAAIAATEGRVTGLLDAGSGASAVAVTDAFLDAWRALLTGADYNAGCALVAVTVATDTPAVRGRAGEAFRTWRGRLAQALNSGGLPEAQATATAAMLLAAAEGAVVMCRAERDIAPFDLVAAQLRDHVRHVMSTGG